MTNQEPSARANVNDLLDSAVAAIDDFAPFGGMTRAQIVAALARWAAALGKHPAVLLSDVLQLASAQARVAAGVSTVEPAKGDRRFTDSAWQLPVWRQVSQSYLTWRSAVVDSVDGLGLDDKSAARAKFALGQIVEAAAPTNALLGNPAALRKAWKTRGRSLVDGARHMAHDLRHNGGMPSQVDSRPFRVGETTAVTPGAVVHRTEMYELIQYAPVGSEVYTLPTVVVPPQVNRYYFLDIAPGRSFVEHSVGRGIQTFLISWRNPGPQQRDWSLDDYAASIIDAMRQAACIAGSDQVNATAFCSGGMTMATVLAHLTATNDNLVNAATLAVAPLDTQVPSALNDFASQLSIRASIASSRRKGIVDGKSLARVFAWVRPNDLVWNYVVNNYLLGENPPAFDVLAWNADATNLPAALHTQLVHLWLDNGLMRPGTLEVLGTKVDLAEVKTDIYAVGALTDHLVPWQSAYAATQAFGSQVRFVLSSSGHIQALINPPGNPKATFLSADETPADPEQWLRKATKTAGSWWEDWAEWTITRSGAARPRPDELGDATHPVLDTAPGSYVVG